MSFRSIPFYSYVFLPLVTSRYSFATLLHYSKSPQRPSKDYNYEFIVIMMLACVRTLVRFINFAGSVRAYRALNVLLPATWIEPEVPPVSNPGYVVSYIYDNTQSKESSSIASYSSGGEEVSGAVNSDGESSLSWCRGLSSSPLQSAERHTTKHYSNWISCEP